MNRNTNSDKAAGTYVVAPEFCLLENPALLDDQTAKGFDFADAKGRRILFAMRKLLNNAFPGSKSAIHGYDDYIYAIKTIRDFLNQTDIPKDTRILFPGRLLPIPSPDHVESVSALCGHITVDLRHHYTTEYLQYISENGLIKNKCINVITDRVIQRDAMKTICDLWDQGADLTLCYGYSALKTLKFFGLPSDGDLDIYNGSLTVPGKTLIKCISFDTSITVHEEHALTYHEIKEALQNIIEKEVSVRFGKSQTGKHYYRHDSTYDPIDPLGLFYRRCISEKDNKISNIFHGGAEFDILSVSLAGNSENNENLVNCLAAACRSFDGSYPIKAVPVLRDIRYAEEEKDIPNIITSHANNARNVYGGSVLELTLSDKIDLTDYGLVRKMISALFGSGGIMIKITKEAK